MRLRIIQVLALLSVSAGSAFGQFTLTNVPNPSVVGQAVMLTAGPLPSNSTVTFYDGGAPTGTPIGSVNSGTGTSVQISVSTLSLGVHSLIACYLGPIFANVCSNTVTQTVNPPPPTLTSNPNPSTVGQAITLAASPVPANTTVTFLDGATDGLGGAVIGSGSTPNPGGTVSIQVSTLAAGFHSLIACYGELLTCSNTVNQQVNSPPPPNFTLTTSPNPSNPGQAVTLTASPAPSFTTVTFYDGGSSSGPVIGSGNSQGGTAVTIQVSTLTAGTHQLIACYIPSGNSLLLNMVCSNTVPQVVSLTPTSLALTSSLNPSGPCQPVTFTASITPNTATGSVTFSDGTTTLQTVLVSNGSASLTVPSFTLGTHLIQARYVPDPGFAGSSSSLGQTVTSSTSVTLSSAPNPSSSGQTVTITVTVAPAACAGTTPPTAVPTGTVSFLDGGTQIGQSLLAAGTATFSTSTLALGNHVLSAQYNGDTNYGSNSSNSVTQVVNGTKPTTTTLTTSANPITTAQSLTLTATVTPSTATGQVQFKDGTNVIGTSALVGGTATLTLSNIPAGVHSLTAVYLGDTNFNSSTSNTVNETVNSTTANNTTTVLTTSANPINTTQQLTLTVTVTPSGATGQVQFKDGTNVVGTSALVGGTASLTLSNIPAGVHSLTAIYLGDTNFNGSTSNTVNETVNSLTATNTNTVLTVAPSPALTGQPVTLTATVTPLGATGQVQFLDGGAVIGTSTLTAGTASLTISTLAVGIHTLTATYLGDANFNSSTSGPVTQLVLTPTAGGTTVTVTSSLNPAALCQSVTLTAAITPANATGSVTFTDGPTTLGTVALSGGTASFSTAGLALGNYQIVATYGGNSNYGPSSGALTQTVSASVTVTLSISPNPSNLNQAVTLTATVTAPACQAAPPPAPTGTVTFFDGTTQIGQSSLVAGIATLQTSTLTTGNHGVSARYGGDANYGGLTSPTVAQTVGTAPTRPTQTTLTSSPNPSTFGQTLTLNSTVSPVTGTGTPTGTVTFNDGFTTLGSATLTGGSASFSISTLTVGIHSLVASYSGDSTFSQGSSLPVIQQVNQATTTTALTALPTSTRPGQAVQLSAKVTPPTATGTITFMDGATAIGAPVLVVGGSASTSTSSLTNGNHTLTAVYSGDPNFLGSTSPPVTVSVGLTPSTTALSVTPPSTTFGQPVTLTATVAPAGATGSVNFMDGTATLGNQTLVNGTATFTTSSLSAGSHSLSAVYSGDTTFATSASSTVTETVTKGNSTTVLTATPSPGSTGVFALTATVTPSTATGTVTFLDGSTTLGSSTLSNGIATFTTAALSPGNHSFTAVYAGDANLNGGTSPAVTETVTGPCAPLGNMSPTALNPAIVGTPYSQTFTVTGGCLPLTWSLASGAVAGLTLSSAGVLSGTATTPTATPTSLTVGVHDSANPLQATAIVVTLTVLPAPTPSISIKPIISVTDQPAPQVTISPAYPLALIGTFSLSFTPSAANLPANYVNPDVKFIGGSTTTGPINFPANSTAPVTLPAIQLGTVAGTITVTLATLTTSTGQTVLPANPVTATITVPATVPTIVPGSVKIINITSTGFSVFLDGTSTTRDLTSASLTFTAASGSQLNGTQFTVALTAAATAWFSDAGANRGVANGGAFSLTLPFAYSGDTTAIGTVSVTVTNSVGPSASATGGR